MVLIRRLGRDSALYRELAGDNADVDLGDHLLAHIGTLLAGANWQRGGGKGSRPKPVKVGADTAKQPADRPVKTRQQRGDDYAARLANLGLIPAT
ncbi:hypothetical protein BDK92_7247 [Micromonospora pisi]|uniref:Uncharacterized protein n=1 Tax=Micromonospora pisi TaxID=589240 RepID=A0A495JUS2_9ACTN|nr:hypothetical protein [Micromonospora pisi]RKR92767.1 hypothetical protein BDK92_7247 [Micromonospora pisi]